MIYADPALNKLIDAAAARADLPEPTAADLVRLALDTLDIDMSEDRAFTVLCSILLCDNLAEAIYGRL